MSGFYSEQNRLMAPQHHYRLHSDIRFNQILVPSVKCFIISSPSVFIRHIRGGWSSL